MLYPTILPFYLYLINNNNIAINPDILDSGVDAIAFDVTNYEMTLTFKGEWFRVYDKNQNIIRLGKIGSVFGKQFAYGVDAAVIVNDPDSNVVHPSDYLYLFKGDIVSRYLIYLFGRHKSELMIISEANDLHQLSQISDKLPDSIDTVIAYNGYVYLFRNNTQYKLYMKNPKTLAGSEVTINTGLTGVIPGPNSRSLYEYGKYLTESLSIGSYIIRARYAFYKLFVFSLIAAGLFISMFLLGFVIRCVIQQVCH